MRLLVFSSVLLFAGTTFGDVPEGNWPSWRGVDGTGVVSEGNPPTEWSETKNVKWKTKLPGEGQSTPIIWGDKIFAQQAISIGVDRGEIKSAFGGGAPPSKRITVPYKFVVFCLSRETGDILWETEVVKAQPHEGYHPSASLAPYTPVTDGKHVWASFGSRGIYCLDFDGNVVWQQDADPMRMAGKYGEGSSPVLVDNAVVVLADHEGQSKITAYEKNTGNILWQNERREISSWGTPISTKINGRTEIITSASNAIRSYNLADGSVIWQCSGLTNCAAASPVIADGIAYFSTGFRGISTIAIELGHEGDLTDTDAVRWSSRRVGTNVPSPLVYDNRLYVFRGYSPNLSSFDATTGEEIMPRERLSGLKEVYASPLAVNGNIYICSRNGATAVLKSGDTIDVVAVNQLDETLDGSPVVIGDTLFLRGRSHIYCIAEE